MRHQNRIGKKGSFVTKQYIIKMARKILFLLLVNVFAITLTKAQQITRFAYIQTDNKQPFYLKWNGKILSSSTSGYLIVPKIKEPQVSAVIGFPKNLYPEQSFTLIFNGNKDAGFLLKNFGNKGWGLYNLQTLAVVYAVNNIPTAEIKVETVNTPVINPPKVEETKSPFGDLLVQVTQDSTIKNTTVEKPKEVVVIKKPVDVKPVIDTVKREVKADVKPIASETKKEAKPAETKTEAVKNDTAKTEAKVNIKQPVVPVGEEAKPVEKNEKDLKKVDTVNAVIKRGTKTVANTGVFNSPPLGDGGLSIKSSVNLFTTNENAEGWNYIYIDEEKTGQKDTISIFIAKEKIEIKSVIKTEPEIKDTIKKETPVQPKFIDIIVDTVKKETVKEPAKAVMVNTDCKNMASDKDFIALRKKMAAEESDDDMVTAARKVFKTKCFTSEQVKNLCVLFLKDDGKYKFLDAAYPFVYDTDNFKQLGSLLTEEYYLNRFKAMIKN